MNTEILNFISSSISIVAVLIILISLPGVASSLLFKNIEERSYTFLKNPDNTMSFGVMILLIGKLGTTVSNNDLNNSQIIYGIIITIAATLYILCRIFAAQSLKKNLLNSKSLSNSNKIVNVQPKVAEILIIGLNVILIQHFVLV